MQETEQKSTIWLILLGIGTMMGFSIGVKWKNQLYPNLKNKENRPQGVDVCS